MFASPPSPASSAESVLSSPPNLLIWNCPIICCLLMEKYASPNKLPPCLGPLLRGGAH
ncbi:hypothetical protein CBOM_03243 [Ceraceosorus bombacis]|uniref:Uncharacterized protein n=1 Tax=Ceraceosorus bombacis TaxID=401625 RepID=A0A0P1BKZ8_9BASI|nr:hypothetical protein CBOM_03243 [Ceraceosorus bombacis]